MYNRIFYYLIRPHQAIQKIVLKIQNFYKKKNYNLNLFETEQNDLYKKRRTRSGNKLIDNKVTIKELFQ